MKLVYKICLANFAFTFLIAFLIADDNYFWAALGVYFLIMGLLNCLAGFVLMEMKKKEWAEGFFVSGGLLLLTGFAVCSPVLLQFNQPRGLHHQ